MHDGLRASSKAALDFRDTLSRLEDDGELSRVSREVDPDLELIAVTRKMQRTLNRGLLFTNVRETVGAVATNVLSTRPRMARALGVGDGELLDWIEAGYSAPIDPVEVQGAPVQEVVATDDVDIARHIPQIVHCEGDAGPYVTAGVVIAKHPDTGVYNASFNRSQIVGGSHARLRMMAPQHLGQYQQLSEGRGEPLPVAMVIGAPPALMLSAASKIPLGADELQIAGAWQGSALRVTPAVSVPLMVPADAEYVIEGEVIPNAREIEGPYGEFTDTYVEPAENHVLRVTAITRRADPIYHTILAGSPEDVSLLAVPLQLEVLKHVRAFADVVDVATPGHIFGCVVSIRKRNDEQPPAVLMAALAAHSWMKMVVVVDEDINPHDAEEVLWAIQTRARPDTGLFHIPRLASFPRADVRPVHKGKIGIDATVPMDLKTVFKRREFPDIALEDYLDAPAD